MSDIVYSTKHGKMCPKCGLPVGRCQCRSAKDAPKGDGNVRVARQTKGRKGKGVSIITGIPLSGEELKDLSRTLKQKIGTGGAVKSGTIEIQGDHRDVLVSELQKLGYKAKKSGG